MRDFTIRSNTNGLGLQSNAIKDLCPLILHQLVVGWIGKAHGPTVQFEIIISKVCNIHGTKKFIARAKFVVRPKSLSLSLSLSLNCLFFLVTLILVDELLCFFFF